ncbi:hypothetical protein L0337_07320 [candidate division KSB1 bacterium]|nr:hypothetical protein [candidate division KSB1 bacterium]
MESFQRDDKKNQQHIAAIFFTFFLSLAANLQAQAYYPTQTGNRWDYVRKQWWAGATDTTQGFKTVRVIGDILMPNGKSSFPTNSGR